MLEVAQQCNVFSIADQWAVGRSGEIESSINIFIIIMVLETPPDTYLMVGPTIFNTPLSFVGNIIDIRNLQMFPLH